MGTMLQAAGLALGTAPERWNLEHPEWVAAIHRAYAEAGVAWVQTNTFGATRPRLALDGLADRVAAINAAAVRCAREGTAALPVLGTVGPTGAREPETWEAAYAEQLEALAATGIDGVIVETIVALEEGLAAVRAAAAVGIEKIFATWTPDVEGRLLDGTAPEQAAEALRSAGAAIIGVNCGAGPESLLPTVRRLAAAGLGPVLAAPNAGLPELVDGQAVYGLDADGFARAAIQFREAGAQFLTGCCGTTPDHLRAAIAALRSPPPNR
jgi:5-methyltetrahydrofolate--homocysteine methyltransferase